MKPQVGSEVIFLDDNNQRHGTIESIDNNSVQICGLDGTLYITSIENIMYVLTY